jgi:FMN phosphatase YigB (HAD superfamily)
VSVDAVFFDVGETLICEDRIWREWAEWCGVPPLTFMGALGAVIGRRGSHLEVFDYFVDDFDLERVQAERVAGGFVRGFGAPDLYPDALPCLRALKAAGLRVGIAGNQPADVTESFFGSCGVELDVVASSAGWGIEKPDPAFFARVAEVAGLPPVRVAYVGDRVDNDVAPAAAAGMVAVFLRRGPWGVIHSAWPEATKATYRIESLQELPDLLATSG